jgi:hypothetical protein
VYFLAGMNLYEKKRKKKVILDEEEYIQKLESIIERDYFPDSADHKKLSSSFDESAGDQQRKETDSISVNQFFEVYNSEDNESFEVLQEKHLAEKRRKFHWLYESPGGKSAGMLMWYYQKGGVLTVEDREKMDKLLECPTTVGDDRPNGCDTWRFRVRNQLMFPPELEGSKDTCLLPSTDPAAIARLTSSEIIESNSQSAASELSLVTISEAPDSIRMPSQKDRTLNLPVREISPIKSKQNPAEEKLMPPPSIIPQNTRLVDRGAPVGFVSSSPLEAPHTPSSVGTDQGNSFYRSVCMTPSPFPEVGSSHLHSPLMTWGEICGTPNVLTGSSSESNPFHISDMTNREKRARLLDTSHNQRTRKSAASSDHSKKTQTSKISRMMKTPLTPAGRALAERLSTTTTSDWGSLERPHSIKRVKKEVMLPSPKIDPVASSRQQTSEIRTDNLLRL